MAKWQADSIASKEESDGLLEYLRNNYKPFSYSVRTNAAGKVVVLDFPEMTDEQLQTLKADLVLRFPGAFE